MAKKEAHHSVEHHNPRLEESILHNLVELQRVHVNIAEKFDKLSNQIAQLLGLFESTALSFAKQSPTMASEKDREFLNKIDKLLEQNKTLAKGLMMMEDRMRERVYGPPQGQNQMMPSRDMSRPLPRI